MAGHLEGEIFLLVEVGKGHATDESGEVLVGYGGVDDVSLKSQLFGDLLDLQLVHTYEHVALDLRWVSVGYHVEGAGCVG